jgi:hypothetical protein
VSAKWRNAKAFLTIEEEFDFVGSQMPIVHSCLHEALRAVRRAGFRVSG